MRTAQRGCLTLLAVTLCAAETAVGEGVRLFQEGRYTAARERLQEVVRQAPSDETARGFLALAQAATGGCEVAEPELQRGFGEGKDDGVRRLAGLALAQCQLTLRGADAALPVVAQLRTRYPADADVLYLGAKLHLRAWNDVVEQMYAKTPASYRVNQLSAEIFETQGKHGEAVAEYRKAIAKNPQAINLHYRLGRALLMELHEPAALAAARREFEAELALNAEDSAAEYQVGQILLAEGKPDLAGPRFERALTLRPDFPEALVAVAKLRLSARQYPAAVELLERAVRLQPRNETAHYSLMMAYRNAGQPEKAQREKQELDRLQRPPEGEFTEFLKRIGETPAKP